MLARPLLIASLLSAPGAQAADLAIRAVVVKSARISGAVISTSSAEKVQTTTSATEDGRLRIVFTP